MGTRIAGADNMTFIHPPEPVGHWVWDGGMDVKIAVYRRPSRWHQFWNRVLLGWRWEDEY